VVNLSLSRLAVAVGGLALSLNAWAAVASGRSRSGSDRQHNLQLPAGDVGAERARPGNCRAIQRIPGE
jgi:hypothetical protein